MASGIMFKFEKQSVVPGCSTPSYRVIDESKPSEPPFATVESFPATEASPTTTFRDKSGSHYASLIFTPGRRVTVRTRFYDNQDLGRWLSQWTTSDNFDLVWESSGGRRRDVSTVIFECGSCCLTKPLQLVLIYKTDKHRKALAYCFSDDNGEFLFISNRATEAKLENDCIIYATLNFSNYV
jgi:hypothetical protein